MNPNGAASHPAGTSTEIESMKRKPGPRCGEPVRPEDTEGRMYPDGAVSHDECEEAMEFDRENAAELASEG